MEKLDDMYIYEKLKENGVVTPVPRKYDVEKDYYAKGIVRAEDLKHGQYYIGRGRNFIFGRWDAENKVMKHKRFKFGTFYTDDVNYVDNDNGCDLFVALHEVDEDQVPEEKRVEI